MADDLESSDVTRSKELQLAFSDDNYNVERCVTDAKHELEMQIAEDSTGQLKVVKNTLLKLLKMSDDAIELLLQISSEDPTVTDIGARLFEILRDICKYLTTLEPHVLDFVGKAMYLDSTQSITLMYKFHDMYFLSKCVA